MKKLINLLVTLVILTTMACMEDKRDQGRTQQESEQIENQQITADNNSNQPEESNAPEEEVDTLEEASQEEGQNAISINSNEQEDNGEIQSHQQQDSYAEENNENGSWLSLLALLFGVAAISMSLYNTYSLKKREGESFNRIEHLEKDVERKWLKIKQSFTECAKDQDCKALCNTVRDLENRINSLPQNVRSSQKTGGELAKGSEPSITNKSPREGYFGIPRGNENELILFNEYSDYLTDRSYFKALFFDEDECEFFPFDLEKLRTIDAVKKAVDYTGCSIQYAKKMEVTQKGYAKYDNDNHYWRIMDKAIVELKN